MCFKVISSCFNWRKYTNIICFSKKKLFFCIETKKNIYLRLADYMKEFLTYI